MILDKIDDLISIDAESNGLGGRAFAVGMTLSCRGGELDSVVLRCPIDGPQVPWVSENVLPVLDDVPVDCDSYDQMLAKIATTIQKWGGRDTPMIAHVAWPVEARLLLDVYRGDRVWAGPYPLLDVSSLLSALGHDPLSVDGYLKRFGVDLPPGSPHHPLYDARAAERCVRDLAQASKNRRVRG